jgi:hypothetical protein
MHPVRWKKGRIVTGQKNILASRKDTDLEYRMALGGTGSEATYQSLRGLECHTYHRPRLRQNKT